MKKRRHSNAGVFKNTFFTAHVRQLLLGQKRTATSIQLERDQITDYTARTLSKYGLYSKCLPLDFTNFSRVAIFTEHLRAIISTLPAAPTVLTYIVCERIKFYQIIRQIDSFNQQTNLIVLRLQFTKKIV